jgi:hypothetical protein
MAETLQMVVTASVCSQQPLSLIQEERTECPLLKAQAFALVWWIRKTNMSAVC